MGRDRRVVITSMGAITPLGLSLDQTWQQLCQGICGIAPITAFDPAGFSCKIAGQVPEFKVQKFVPKSHRKAIKLMSRDIQLAIIAAKQTFENSGLITKGIDESKTDVEPTRMAINLGVGLISCDLVELAPAVAKSITNGKFDIHKWGKAGLEAVTPLWLLKYLPNMLACHIGIIHDIQGPSNTITCGEASGQLAICEAYQTIARDSADIALAGGGEAKVNPIVMLRQCLLKRATASANHCPEKACRPFSADATGSVFGEAAAMMILEDLENARSRGAKIYAEVAGCGSSNSINPNYEHLEPDGQGLRIAIEKAVEQAGIRPEQLDLIIPHGTGIPQDDLAEATAIQNVLGQATAKTAVLPTKSMLSNTGAATGALDAVIAAKAMDEGKIPAAKNCENKAPGCKLNIVKKTRQADIRYALCCSYTFGGQTAAVVLKKTT